MAPQKPHHRPHPAAPLRHHSRTSSGGSSKLGIHLQFTQKDTHPPHKHHPTRRSSTHHHESYPHPDSRSSSASPPLRAPAAPPARTPSKDHLSPHKHTTHRTHTRNNSGGGGAKSKPDFTLASPATDESDWVSSDPDRANKSAAGKQPVQPAPASRGPESEADDSPFTQLPIDRPTADVSAPVPPASRMPAPTSNDPDPQRKPNESTHRPQHHEQPQPQSQPRPRPDTAKRHSRPSSMYSITNRSDGAVLRPHPLIRGLSNTPVSPVPPVTLLTINPTAQLSSSPPPISTTTTTTARMTIIQPRLTTSPTRLTSSPHSPPASPVAGRRTSVSSARSVATLPVSLVPSLSTSKEHAYILGPNRHRTHSVVSATASSAALSSLAQLPATPRCVTPQLVSFFPSPNPHLETIHPLLPPPYLATHMTVLSHRSPLRESYDRVIRAKLGR